MASGGRKVPGAAVVVALLLLLVAGGADADCFDYCYKNCIGNDRSMADYCNYACDKTCTPDSSLTATVLHHHHRPLAAAATVAGADEDLTDDRCDINCATRTCGGLRRDRKGMVALACYEWCFHGCRAKTVPMPLRAGAGVDASGSSGAVSERRRVGNVRSTSEPDAARPASVFEQPVHEKQDGVQPASASNHPFHEKQDVVEPAKMMPDHPFHEKKDGVQPTDHPFHEKQDAVEPSKGSGHPFHKKQDAVPNHP